MRNCRVSRSGEPCASSVAGPAASARRSALARRGPSRSSASVSGSSRGRPVSVSTRPPRGSFTWRWSPSRAGVVTADKASAPAWSSRRTRSATSLSGRVATETPESSGLMLWTRTCPSMPRLAARPATSLPRVSRSIRIERMSMPRLGRLLPELAGWLGRACGLASGLRWIVACPIETRSMRATSPISRSGRQSSRRSSRVA